MQLAIGVLSALGVGQYPVLLSSDPGVHSGVLRQGTAVPPADHSSEGVPAILLDHQGTSGVSLAGVLASVSSADHVAVREEGQITLILGLEVLPGDISSVGRVAGLV